ncbi:MAG TPA: BamA/TamA family outer membrane protein [Gemmatimonadaceae bacterium]|jgi:outer membrane protein assembly factor BamA|nr:BamA/TamA family outer membrane protein [Gemmatimonadaceae bacterium]
MSKLETLLLLAATASSLAAQRQSGVEVSGIPALNFDADEGFGYGAILALYKYEPRSATYRWTVQPTVFMTTRGRRDYTLFFDSPSTDARPWRLTAYAGREQQLAAPYYGVGNETAYDAALETGATRYYYRYGLDRLRASADVQHTLGTPSLRYLVGVGASSETVDLTPFDSGSTLIESDMNGRQPASRRTNYVRAGLTWDTRDREIGTTSGTWADVLVQRVDSKLGASWNYTRWTASARHYQPLGGRVTLANRLVLQNTIGDVPFYSLAELPTAQKSQDGLGGTSSIRGIPKDRYVGKGVLVSNNELRWRAAEFGLIGRPSSLVLSGFVDAGRVWADGVDLSTALRELHSGYGGGARLSFGPSFVISTDVGHSSQSTAAIYIGLGYLF